jgi:hypothetical protein
LFVYSLLWSVWPCIFADNDKFDMWSAGCIFAELLSAVPNFRASLQTRALQEADAALQVATANVATAQVLCYRVFFANSRLTGSGKGEAWGLQNEFMYSCDIRFLALCRPRATRRH